MILPSACNTSVTHSTTYALLGSSRSRDSKIEDHEIQDELSQTQRSNKRRKISRSISGNNEIYIYNDLSQFTDKTPIILKKTYDLVIDGYLGFAFINILDHKLKNSNFKSCNPIQNIA